MKVCSYQEMNYTLSIEDDNNTNILSLGPFNHSGPSTGVASHEIPPGSGLARGHNYSVQLTVITVASGILTATKHFSKANQY